MKNICRNCLHPKERHDPKLFFCESIRPMGFYSWDKPTQVHYLQNYIASLERRCSCLEYIPSDNLEYLEMKADEKGI